MKYIAKPIEVEAIQYLGDNYDKIVSLFNGSLSFEEEYKCMYIKTVYNILRVDMFDWVLKEERGKPLVFSNEGFKLRYEKYIKPKEDEQTTSN